MKKLSLLAISGIILLFGCKKKYDQPPINTIPVGNVLTIKEMVNMFNANGVGFTFDQDYSVYCVATTDETTGNFYKQVYVQDSTAAIQLRLLTSGGIYKGDSIRLYLKGTYISNYKGMMQLDSVDVNKNIIKQATGKTVPPTIRTISQLDPINDQGKWIQINNVEFSGNDLGAKWSNAITQTDVNHDLVDCNGNTIIVRTSGYAKFANDTVPYNNGTFYGILGVYNSTLQMYIQTPDDLQFTNTRCTGGPTILFKDFEDQSITSGGWSTQVVTGTLDWTTNTSAAQFGTAYAQMSNFSGGNSPSETWLISPSIDLTQSATPTLSFENAFNYNGPTLEVLISTNYDGVSAPSTATWNTLNPTLSSGTWAWTNSGPIDLSTFGSSTSAYVAFKYTGTATSGSTWEIDNISIQ